MMSVLESHFLQTFAVAQDIITLRNCPLNVTPGLAPLILQLPFCNLAFLYDFSFLASAKVSFHLTFIDYKSDTNTNKHKLPKTPKHAKVGKECIIFSKNNMILILTRLCGSLQMRKTISRGGIPPQRNKQTPFG